MERMLIEGVVGLELGDKVLISRKDAKDKKEPKMYLFLGMRGMDAIFSSISHGELAVYMVYGSDGILRSNEFNVMLLAKAKYGVSNTFGYAMSFKEELE